MAYFSASGINFSYPSSSGCPSSGMAYRSEQYSQQHFLAPINVTAGNIQFPTPLAAGLNIGQAQQVARLINTDQTPLVTGLNTGQAPLVAGLNSGEPLSEQDHQVSHQEFKATAARDLSSIFDLQQEIHHLQFNRRILKPGKRKTSNPDISECPSAKVLVSDDAMTSSMSDLNIDNNNLDWQPDLETSRQSNTIHRYHYRAIPETSPTCSSAAYCEADPCTLPPRDLSNELSTLELDLKMTLHTRESYSDMQHFLMREAASGVRCECEGIQDCSVFDRFSNTLCARSYVAGVYNEDSPTFDDMEL